MNKKIYIILILALVLIPMVSAQAVSEAVERILGLILDAPEELVYIKAAIWFVLFYLIFKSAERIFPQSRGTAAMMALIVAVVGARYMPEEYLEVIGGWYAIILGIVFFLAPYFFGNIVGDLMRLGRTGKTFLILLFYGALAYFLMKWEGIPLEGEAANALEAALAYISDHFVIALIIIGIICFFILRRTGGGVRQPRMGGPKGPGFWNQLGQGAGEGGGRLRDWFRRKKQSQAAQQKGIQRKMIEDKKWRQAKQKAAYQKPGIKSRFGWGRAKQKAAYQKPGIKSRFAWFRRKKQQQAAQQKGIQRKMIEDKRWREQQQKAKQPKPGPWRRLGAPKMIQKWMGKQRPQQPTGGRGYDQKTIEWARKKMMSLRDMVELASSPGEKENARRALKRFKEKYGNRI